MSVGSFIYVGAVFPASVCIWCMFHQSMAFSDWYTVDLVGIAQQQLSFLLSGFSVWLQMRSNRANCQALWLEPKYANYIHVWNQPMHTNIEKHATKWPTGPSTVSCLITVAMQRKLQLHLNWSKGTGMMSGLQRDICIIHRGCEIHPKGPNHTWMVRGMVDNGEHPHGKNVRHPEEVQSCHPGCLWKFHEGCCATRGPKFSMQSCHHSKRVSDFPHVFLCSSFKDGSVDLSEFGNICVFWCQNKTTTVIIGSCLEDIFQWYSSRVSTTQLQPWVDKF